MAKKSVRKKKERQEREYRLARAGKWNAADGSYVAIPSAADSQIGGMVRGYRGGFKLGPG